MMGELWQQSRPAPFASSLFRWNLLFGNVFWGSWAETGPSFLLLSDLNVCV